MSKSSDEKKDEIIESIYFEPSGFSGITTTWKDAKKKDPSITLEYVKEWFKKRFGEERINRKNNSFVAPEPYFEFQIDLFYPHPSYPKTDFKVGMVCIDIFTKYAEVVALKGKTEGDLASGLIECIRKMGKKPKYLYSDDEPALRGNALQKYFDENNIKHIITRSHPRFAERFIRTFKSMLEKRMEHNKDAQWHELIYQIILTYNNKLVHSSIGMTPNEARKEQNIPKARFQMKMNRKNNYKYPEIKEGDFVKIMKASKRGDKEGDRFTKVSYRVKEIEEEDGVKLYSIEGGTKKQYLRFELLKV